MKKTHLSHILRSAMSLLLAVSLLAGTVPAVFAADTAVSRLEISGINKLDNNAFINNYLDYLNSDVAFRLPDGIKSDDEISVIVRVDRTSVMQAYDRTDKSMTLQQFIVSDEGKAIMDDIAARKSELLTLFDEQGIEYKLGEDYTTIFSGFELIIKGEDYTATCQSLGGGESVAISNSYQQMNTQLVENEVNVLESGIFNTTGIKYDGTGMVVAVLDTGLDSNHTAFSPNNFVIDPNRVYHLDTWDLSSSEDISYTTSLPPIPSAESIPVFTKFVQEIPNNRLMVYLSVMDFNANKIKSPIETESAYVFLTNTEDTLYRISKDGNSMFILDLRDPDNWKFKNEVYAKANVGMKHKIGDGKVEYKTNFFTDKPSKVGAKGKVDIDEIAVFDQLEWQHVTEEEISKGQSQNDEKTAGQVGAKVGSSLEVSNFSHVNGRYIRFVSDNYALVGDGYIGGGHKPKAKAEIKAELSTSMSKSDVSAGLEVGLDVAEVSLGGGYLKVVENGYYISKVDIKGTAGPSAGVSVGLKRGKVKGFLFGLGWDISKEFVSFPKAN